jgi:hypothetical protein
MSLKQDFQRVQCLWDYMVVKASWRSYIVHHDQSGLSRPNLKGIRERKWQFSQYNIYNVVNVNKIINELRTRIFQGSNAYGITWCLKPHGGLT